MEKWNANTYAQTTALWWGWQGKTWEGGRKWITKSFYLSKNQNCLGIFHLKNQLRAWSKTREFLRKVLQLQITSNLTQSRAKVLHEIPCRFLVLISCFVSMVISMCSVLWTNTWSLSFTAGLKKIIWEYRLRPSWEYLQLLKSYPCQVKRWFTQV